MEKLGKHKHKLTEFLKVGIFACVMMAPIFAVGAKCLYVSVNKNAYESYSDNYIEKTIDINSSNANTLYIQNQNVQIVFSNKSYGNRSNKYGFSKINIDLNELLNTQNIVYTSFEFYTGQSNFMYFFDANETQYTLNNYKDIINGFTYTVDLTTYNRTTIYNYVNAYTFTYINQKLDNAFYYACNQLTTEPLFAWTINTGTYTAINAMFTGLGMDNNNPLAVCLCYWMIIMMIYIVIDIVVFLITKMTHVLNDE